MPRIIVLLFGLLVSACAGTGGPSSVISSGPNVTECRQFSQENCLRLDVPSAAEGNVPVPLGSTGRPGGPQTMTALQTSVIQPAGRRTVVIMAWGLGNMPVSALAAYQHRLPHADVQNVTVEEVSPSTAPRFDPAYAPPGPARAFRITYTGGMVSFQLPRSAVLPGTIMLLCPDGQSAYPDRRTVREGVRSQNAIRFTAHDMHRWAHEQRNGRPRFNLVTTEPVVW